MKKANDDLDLQTRLEVLTTVIAMEAAFTEAAADVDRRFPGIPASIRKELIGEAGKEIIEGVAIALEYDHTNDIPEGQVSEMLKAAIRQP